MTLALYFPIIFLPFVIISGTQIRLKTIIVLFYPVSGTGENILINQCPICLKIYSNRTVMLRHVKGFHQKIRGVCNFCGQSFAYDSHLSRHRPRCPKNPNKKRN